MTPNIINGNSTNASQFTLIQIMVVQVAFWGCSAILLCITLIMLLSYILPHKPQADYMDFSTLENIEKIRTCVYFEKAKTSSMKNIQSDNNISRSYIGADFKRVYAATSKSDISDVNEGAKTDTDRNNKNNADKNDKNKTYTNDNYNTSQSYTSEK